MHYCLLIRIAGLTPLRQVMGDLSTRLALQRLANRLSKKLFPVLDHQRIQDERLEFRHEQGLCAVFFTYVTSDQLLSDPDFQQQILLAAETELLESTIGVFGYATARLAQLQAVLLADSTEFPDAASIENAFNRRYRQEHINDEAEQALFSLLRGDGPRILLQPIVELGSGGCTVIGYEALSRGPAGSCIEQADQLFETARQCGLTLELEKSCIRAALGWHKHLPANRFLAINCSAATLNAIDIREKLAAPGLWLELTEHLPLGQSDQLLPVLQQLKASGTRIALDDTGCGYADLQAAQTLKPDVVKLCITIIHALKDNQDIIRELEATIASLHALGIRVLAEGVETGQQALLLQQLGIDYAQGWYFARPTEAAQCLQKYRGRLPL